MSLLSVQIDVQTALALFDRVFEYLDLPVEISERPRPVVPDSATLNGEVAFEDVSFSYAGAENATLDDVTLAVPAGTTTAVVGETGSGKTTLGHLVARLCDADDGRVTIDGRDVRDLSFASHADAVGVVSRETYLVHATVRENIRFARPEATDEEIEIAARAARIHHVIAALPEGRTVIAIAHRLSTVRDAERILVLDRGRIVERGTHDELAALGGHYAAMLNGAGELEPA